jgi:hypothetical protein
MMVPFPISRMRADFVTKDPGRYCLTILGQPLDEAWRFCNLQ